MDLVVLSVGGNEGGGFMRLDKVWCGACVGANLGLVSGGDDGALIIDDDDLSEFGEYGEFIADEVVGELWLSAGVF